MAKMASEYAEQNTEPTFSDLVEELQQLVKAENPDDRADLVMARCYGIVLAHITKDQMLQIVSKRRKAN